MEVPFIPQNSPQKLDSAKTQAVGTRKVANAYSAAKASATDEIQISSKSKLMQKLRASYAELDKADGSKAPELKKISIDDKLVKMSSEEIVHGILKGTIFETI
ncbi:MAG: hypothetical protein WCX65_03645 [bacterium]